jgi:ankyrin repeat protein
MRYIEPFVQNYPLPIDYDEYIPEERLHKAIVFHDITKVNELLQCEPNYIDYTAKAPYRPHHTPLSLACEHGFSEAFYLLLEHGAEIYPSLLFDLIDFSTYNPISYIDSYEIIVQELIRRGASVNYQDPDRYGMNALHCCYQNTTSNVVKQLLEAGADIHATTQSFEKTNIRKNVYQIDRYFIIDADPLMYMTVFMPHIDIFRVLLEHGKGCTRAKDEGTLQPIGANPNRKNVVGLTAFMGIFVSPFFYKHYNSDDKYHELVQLFLDHGADLYMKDDDGNTALDYLCLESNVNVNLRMSTVRYLHEKSYIKIHHPKSMDFLHKSILSGVSAENKQKTSV